MRDVAQAAERLRKPGLRAVAFHTGQGCVDIGTLADAYLAEHPADDAEPISEEWLRSVWFVAVESDMGRNYSDHFEIEAASKGTLNLWEFNQTGDWLINGFDSWPLKSRGDVRRLCAALGIQLKEGSQP